jgi:hypothetical protein
MVLLLPAEVTPGCRERVAAEVFAHGVDVSTTLQQ